MKNSCIDCGMCSDGTMYRRVHIREGDQLAPLKAAGAELVTWNGQSAFQLPCPAFRGGCCSIDEARTLITSTLAIRDRVLPALNAFVEPQVPEAMSDLYRMMVAKFEAMPDPAKSRREVAALLLDIAALRVPLAWEFEPRESDPPGADDEQDRGSATADPKEALDPAL